MNLDQEYFKQVKEAALLSRFNRKRHPLTPPPISPEALCALARATRPHTDEPWANGMPMFKVEKEAPDLEWHLRKVKTSLVWAAFVECEAPDSPWWERRVDSRPSHDRTLNET